MTRTLGIILVGAAALAAAPTRAHAQHCHVDVPDDTHVAASDEHAHHGHHAATPRRWWLGASSAVIAGSGSMAGDARDYQGLSLAVSAGWRRLSARAALPVFRVAEEGFGLGDGLLAIAADAMPGRGRVRAGLALSASLPTGDSDAGRGMGHVMVAAGAWLRVPLVGSARVDGSAVWARALGDGAEHAAHMHLATMWPLVDPMNPEEVVVDGRATGSVASWLRAGGGGIYGAPLGDGGATRVVIYAVAELVRDRYTLSTQLAAPVVGDPYVARGQLELAYRY